MLEKMSASEEGSEILRLRPRINSKTVDLEKLKDLPRGTLGRIYWEFLDENVGAHTTNKFLTVLTTKSTFLFRK